MKIRRFEPSDTGMCVEILKLNSQYSHPEIDGPEAMLRIYEKSDSPFFVAEYGGSVVGLVRGCYDGSRALIWQASVHPDYQGKRIGRALIKEIAKSFKRMGAPSVSVTATEKSKSFYEEFSFKEIPVKFMLAENIDDILKK